MCNKHVWYGMDILNAPKNEYIDVGNTVDVKTFNEQ